MQESHRQGLASQPDPESCVGGRKATGEALTGAHAGQPSSCEINSSGVPTPLTEAEGNIAGGVKGEPLTDPAQSKTLSMRGNSSRGNREIPEIPSPQGRDGWRRPVPHVQHVRFREVGRFHSTEEAGEQRHEVSGARGGKGIGQGEPCPKGRVPDSEPGLRVVPNR